MDDGEIASAAKNGLECAGGFECNGDATGTGDWATGDDKPARPHKFDCK